MRFRLHSCRTAALASVLVLTAACAMNAPPNLSPASLATYKANQAVVAIGTVQHVGIELNKVQVCDPAPCHALLSDANTRIVVDAATDALTTIRLVPDGWKATALAFLTRVDGRLDAAGKSDLKAYVQAARDVITRWQ